MANDFLNPAGRRFDPRLSARTARYGQTAGRNIGQGIFNRGTRGLKERGLGRSTGVLNLGLQAGGAESNFLSNLFHRQGLAEQEFTEGARRFDVGATLDDRRRRTALEIARMNQPGFWDVFGGVLGAGAQVGTAALL